MLKAHHHPVKLMGCGFVISAISDSPQEAWDAIRAAENEMRRIELKISSWREDSETAEINKQSGIKAVDVSDETFDLIHRSLKVSQLTSGAFDISGNLARFYWQFDNKEHTLLEEGKISELRDLINYELIELDEAKRSVFLKKKGMKIGFGGIGKGYAANRAKTIMQNMGIKSGLINASGDLISWGKALNNDTWDIQIPDPRNRDQSLIEISFEEGSVVTSGSYENFSIIDGVRYSHIVNPKTGIPVTHTKNVTVVSPDAELGDALATAFSVLEIEQSLNLANKLNGIECVIIDDTDKAHYSNNLKI